ncbi:nucleotidyltransferase family protein [Candidatus Woesearchaeota archaeon]|nr:nucleotidyltransferase family protein [Candidatus Woesearchaeota archaeon]
MKAIILAAGYATRLYPLTKDKPKPLLDVKGKLIINYIIEKIPQEVDHIYVVTNNKFFSHFEEWKKSIAKPITIVNDLTMSNDDRLGSLGDIRFVIDKFSLNEDLLIVAGDNLFEFGLEEIYSYFKEKRNNVVALYDVQNKELAKLYGIVSIAENGKIVHFEEKPQEPRSTLSSTGVYFYPAQTIQKLIEFLDSTQKSDKAGDFLEWLYTKEDVFGYPVKKKWFDIGSLEQLELAEKEFLS